MEAWRQPGFPACFSSVLGRQRPAPASALRSCSKHQGCFFITGLHRGFQPNRLQLAVFILAVCLNRVSPNPSFLSSGACLQWITMSHTCNSVSCLSPCEHACQPVGLRVQSLYLKSCAHLLIAGTEALVHSFKKFFRDTVLLWKTEAVKRFCQQQVSWLIFSYRKILSTRYSIQN